MLMSQALEFFDPATAFDVVHGRSLPHWLQAGVVTFITWRTWDSMPAQTLTEWTAARSEWLRARGLDESQPDWQLKLTPEELHTYRSFVAERWETALDGGLGSCPFRTPSNARVVADSVRHFDGTRYRMHDFVVMPNHVHLLASFPQNDMRQQCESWKRFTGTRLNAVFSRSGRFWASDAFDHLVRSPEQFAHFRRYIAENPKKAGLQAGEYVHYSESDPHPEGAAT
jgi:putative transposase